MLSLNFTNRNKGEIKAGMLKGVFYNSKENSTSIFVNAIDFQKVYREARESSVIELEGEGRKLQVLVQDVSYDPVKDIPTHVDFYVTEKGVKLDASVPLGFVGESEAVKTFGGNIVKVLHEINVEAEPTNLPHSISVDLSLLKDLDSVIKLKDLNLGKGVALYHMEEDEVVASVEFAQEEDLSAPIQGDISAIEVAEKKKKEDSEKE